MAETRGRHLRIFLLDGPPEGLLTVEILTWPGHVLSFPREKAGEALNRKEAGKPGIYFLVGEDPDQPSKTKVYVGESVNVSGRMANHLTGDQKEFWTRACFFTAKDDNLTKAHVQYLESRLISMVKEADRANLANGNLHGAKGLPEADESDICHFERFNSSLVRGTSKSDLHHAAYRYA